MVLSAGACQQLPETPIFLIIFSSICGRKVVSTGRLPVMTGDYRHLPKYVGICRNRMEINRSYQLTTISLPTIVIADIPNTKIMRPAKGRFFAPTSSEMMMKD